MGNRNRNKLILKGALTAFFSIGLLNMLVYTTEIFLGLNLKFHHNILTILIMLVLGILSYIMIYKAGIDEVNKSMLFYYLGFLLVLIVLRVMIILVKNQIQMQYQTMGGLAGMFGPSISIRPNTLAFVFFPVTILISYFLYFIYRKK